MACGSNNSIIVTLIICAVSELLQRNVIIVLSKVIISNVHVKKYGETISIATT